MTSSTTKENPLDGLLGSYEVILNCTENRPSEVGVHVTVPDAPLSVNADPKLLGGRSADNADSLVVESA